MSLVSEEADVALVKGDLSGLKRPILKIDARKDAAISGQPLLSLGYATGLSAILARAGEEAVNDIVKTTCVYPQNTILKLTAPNPDVPPGTARPTGHLL